jgi:hypothetical protein
MKRKRYSILLIISIFIFSLGYLVLKPAFNYLSGYLSKSEQVKANILVVEGWLPDYALRLAYDEFQKNKYDFIITTGLKSYPSYLKIYSNGFLIFYLKNRLSSINDSGPHSIEIDAISEYGGNNRAHFNLFINDSLTGNFFVEKRKKKYEVIWHGNLKNIDSIMVQFDNDHWGKFGDCNLFVKGIIIEHKIFFPYQNCTVWDVYDLGGQERIVNNYNSDAELAKNQLYSLGIDSSKIKTVPGKRARINRTLASALAVRNWLKTANIDIRGINIISLGTHTRRTWMTYNKILNEKYEVGIISLPENNYQNSRLNRVIKTIRETLGIIYYWIILIPY